MTRILEERKISFTDYRDLNDPVEVKLTYMLVKNKIKEIMEFSEKKDFWEHLLEKVLNTFEGTPYTMNSFDCSIYTFSLCTKEDHLPAWRYYGDNGMGYSIGLYPDYFTKKEKSNNLQALNIVCKIIYNRDYFESLINELLQLTEKTLKEEINLAHNREPEILNVLSQQLMSILASNLVSLLPCYKDSGYESEKEYRLFKIETKFEEKFYPCEIANKFETENPAKKKLEKNRECLSMDPFNTQNKIRRASETINDGDICEIWVGPSLDFNCAKKGLENILRKYGYDTGMVKIRKSEAFYR